MIKNNDTNYILILGLMNNERRHILPKFFIQIWSSYVNTSQIILSLVCIEVFVD